MEAIFLIVISTIAGYIVAKLEKLDAAIDSLNVRLIRMELRVPKRKGDNDTTDKDSQ